MKKFYVNFSMSARVLVPVEAENEVDAEQKAEQFMADADFGPCEDIEWEQLDIESDDDEEDYEVDYDDED